MISTSVEPAFPVGLLSSFLLLLTPRSMETFTCTLPDVLPFGVIGEIPPDAWDDVIAEAAQTYAVRLVVRRHAQPGEIPHRHFDISGSEDDLPAVVPKVAVLIAKVLSAHRLRPDIPEGR